jgi:hypothetical protein
MVPPPELVKQWIAQGVNREAGTSFMTWFATQAARWGADMELEACCEWLDNEISAVDPKDLRAERRLKPPSLKEQALETLKYPKDFWSEAEVDTIRLALEQLDD